MLVRPYPLSNYCCLSGYPRHKVGFASHIRHGNFGEVCPASPKMTMTQEIVTRTPYRCAVGIDDRN
jgi:hypothetical protein